MAATDRINPNLLKNVKNLSPEQQREILSLLDELEDAEKKEAARQSFLGFISMAWPSFIEGRHHKIMADAFERVANGELKRLIINMPPRHTKSEFASFLLPAWFLGRFPEKKIIQTAHTAELSVGFGRKVRNLVDSEDFKAVFPAVSLRSDSKAAGRWSTNKGGEYFAIGVGGAVTGKGADLLIIDDPHSEQEGQSADPGVFDKVYEWYTSGPRQRLQPGGAIIVVMTRWHKRDLTGQILKSSLQRQGSDEWEVIEFPAIMPSGEPLWPQFWPKPELEALRNELPASKWNAQYSRIRPRKRAPLSKGNGGANGKKTYPRRVSSLSSPGTRRSLRRKGQITRPAPPGGCSTTPMMMAVCSPISSFWMRTRSAWSSLS